MAGLGSTTNGGGSFRPIRAAIALSSLSGDGVLSLSRSGANLYGPEASYALPASRASVNVPTEAATKLMQFITRAIRNRALDGVHRINEIRLSCPSFRPVEIPTTTILPSLLPSSIHYRSAIRKREHIRIRKAHIGKRPFRLGALSRAPPQSPSLETSPSGVTHKKASVD